MCTIVAGLGCVCLTCVFSVSATVTLHTAGKACADVRVRACMGALSVCAVRVRVHACVCKGACV